MSELCPLDPPRITDDDVAWVCDLLQLPKNAFDGPDGSDPLIIVKFAANESSNEPFFPFSPGGGGSR